MLKRNRQRGFTLIELLIVVAIIGIIAAILIPNLLDALQKAKQKRTVSDIKNGGTAWMAWLTDQVGAASAGQKVYNASASGIAALTYEQLYFYLYPSSTFFYMQEVPQFDGWRNTLKFGVAGGPGNVQVLQSAVMMIGAPSRDNTYNSWQTNFNCNVLEFIATDYNQDIVWGDGYFVAWPGGLK